MKLKLMQKNGEKLNLNARKKNVLDKRGNLYYYKGGE